MASIQWLSHPAVWRDLSTLSRTTLSGQGCSRSAMPSPIAASRASARDAACGFKRLLILMLRRIYVLLSEFDIPPGVISNTQAIPRPHKAGAEKPVAVSVYGFLRKRRRCSPCSPLPLELRPDRRVVGGSGGAAGFQVHIASVTGGGQRGGRQDVVNPPSPIVRERVPEIIPVRVLHAIRIQLPKYILEAPTHRVPVGLPRVDVEIRVVEAAIGVIHVDGLGRDIQISQPQGRPVRIEPFGKVLAHAMEPFELEDILVGADFMSLWNISIHDRDSVDDGFQDAGVFAVRAGAEAVKNRLRFAPGQRRHAVVALHAAEHRVVPGGPEGVRGKFAVLHLGFLQTENVGLMCRQPVHYQGQTAPYRIDVPRRDLHDSSRISDTGRASPGECRAFRPRPARRCSPGPYRLRLRSVRAPSGRRQTVPLRRSQVRQWAGRASRE